MKDPVPVGVVGVGSMGAHHARVLSELSGAELVGIADSDADRAAEVASDHGTQAMGIDALISLAEAVTIATPTETHYRLARMCLDADTDVLVEKPFVTDLVDGEELTRRADRRGLILQIGHIERFNPAVRALPDIVNPEDIVAIRADRLGPPLQRPAADDVILDLMIHDIDIMVNLMGQGPERVTGASRDSDYASVLMEFDGDVVATLTASRLTQRKVRRLKLTTPERHLILDYIDQSIRVHRRSRPSYLQNDTDVRYRHENIIEQPLIESAEPLKLELSAFVDAVRERTKPVVTGEDGLKALTLAQSIRDTLDKRLLEVPQV